MEQKTRLTWIDICRGIGIIFIILSHTPITRNLIGYNYSFQLGIFFFFAGYLFSWKKYLNFKDFFKSRVKGILLPYFFLSLISMIFYLFYYKVPLYSISTFKDMFTTFLFGARNTIFYNIPLWFLPTLFLMENFYYLLKKYWKKDIIIYPAVLYLSCLCFICFNALNKTNVFWTWTAGGYYLIYFAIGNLIKEHPIKIKNNLILSMVLILALAINLSMYFCPITYFSFLDPQTPSWISLRVFFTAIIVMLSGTYVYIRLSNLLSKKLNHAYFLEYLGKNSLIFFGLHIPIMWSIRSFFERFNIQITQRFNLEGIVYLILIILILIPVNYIINRFFPGIVGKRKGVEK